MRAEVEVGLWILLSVVSSTSLILLLKMVKGRLTCQFTMTLSTFHFLATWCCLEVLALFGKIRRYHEVPLRKRLVLALLVVTSIVSMNFSLAANSIGFYQMSKLCCIPYTIIWSVLSRHTKYTPGELLSLVVLLAGVAMFSVSDVEFNAMGTIYGVIAVVSTAHNQVMTGELQSEFKLNGPELQLAIGCEEFLMGVLCAGLMENTGERSFIQTYFEGKDVALMLSTCVFAIGVNLATFGLIGKTSPVTYQVVGHVKTVLLLVIGYVLFPSPWESQRQMVRAIGGIVVALIGVFMYTQIRLKLAAKPTSSVAEETAPLLQKEPKANM